MKKFFIGLFGILSLVGSMFIFNPHVNAQMMDKKVTLVSPDSYNIDYNTNLNLRVELTFDDSTKSGDQVNIALPDYMNTYAGNSRFNVMNEKGEVVGEVIYNGNGTLTFVAGSFFDTHTNVNIDFNLITKPTNRVWENNTEQEIKLTIDNEDTTTGISKKVVVSTNTQYTESLTPAQSYVENKEDIVHMYSTPQFKKNGTYSVEFVSEEYPDVTYNCDYIKTYGINLNYGKNKANYQRINSVTDAEKYNIKVTCTGGTVTLTMDVEEGYGFTTAVPALLSEELKKEQNKDTFWFKNNSIHTDGQTWTGRKPLVYDWQKGGGTGGTTEPSTTEPSTTEPSTTEPSTTEPSTTEPSTTEPSTTEPSTTEPSTTEPSTTEPSTTEPSTTEPSTTELSTTESNTTEPSTTELSTTESNTTPFIKKNDKQSIKSKNERLLPKTGEKKSIILISIGILVLLLGTVIFIKTKINRQ
ncbi:MAG: Ig-like domain-containing protein [Enterococcus faecalis]|nr:Ig-like domain-containing protein [Enterococcus faecalis]